MEELKQEEEHELTPEEIEEKYLEILESLEGGAKIKFIFQTFCHQFDEFKASEDYSDKAFMDVMRSDTGIGLHGFPSEQVFKSFMAPQLEKLVEPSTKLVNDVHEIFWDLSKDLIEEKFMAFPDLCLDY